MDTTARAKPTILVVDDEGRNLDLLQRTLRREYNVLTARSGKEGLDRLSEYPDISVIVTDQRMPNMTGIEMLKRCRKISPEKIRIILTGYTEPKDLIDAINSSRVFCFMTKPWNEEDLRRVLRRAVNLNRAGGFDTLDEITGLPNRIALERIVAREVARAEQVESSLTGLSFHFHGLDAYWESTPDAGEVAICRLSETLRNLLEAVTPGAVHPLAYYDPARFVTLVFSPQATGATAESLAERFRHGIEASAAYGEARAACPNLRLSIGGRTFVRGRDIGATTFLQGIVGEPLPGQDGGTGPA